MPCMHCICWSMSFAVILIMLAELKLNGQVASMNIQFIQHKHLPMKPAQMSQHNWLTCVSKNVSAIVPTGATSTLLLFYIIYLSELSSSSMTATKSINRRRLRMIKDDLGVCPFLQFLPGYQTLRSSTLAKVSHRV